VNYVFKKINYRNESMAKRKPRIMDLLEFNRSFFHKS